MKVNYIIPGGLMGVTIAIDSLHGGEHAIVLLGMSAVMFAVLGVGDALKETK